MAELVPFTIESPQFLACFGIERRNVVIWRGDVQHAADHERRALEETRYGVVFLERRLPMFPLPGDL